MIRRLLFLKKRWVLLTLLVMFAALTVLPASIRWPVFCGCAVFLWLHRRQEIPWRDTLKNDGEIFLSPIDGEVVKIGIWTDPDDGQTYGQLRLKMNFTDNWGLHLPSSSEMEFLKQFQGKSLPRRQLAYLREEELGEFAQTEMLLRSKNGVGSRLRFIHCVNGKVPRIWMKSGDRGRGAACFGHYPFGGSLIVYVPQPSDILVIENEKIEAGQTVLAVFKAQD